MGIIRRNKSVNSINYLGQTKLICCCSDSLTLKMDRPTEKKQTLMNALQIRSLPRWSCSLTRRKWWPSTDGPRMVTVTLASMDTLTEGQGGGWPSTDGPWMVTVTLASMDTLTEGVGRVVAVHGRSMDGHSNFGIHLTEGIGRVAAIHGWSMEGHRKPGIHGWSTDALDNHGILGQPCQRGVLLYSGTGVFTYHNYGLACSSLVPRLRL